MLRLRDHPVLGPFRIAHLEALLRAADWRASGEDACLSWSWPAARQRPMAGGDSAASSAARSWGAPRGDAAILRFVDGGR